MTSPAPSDYTEPDRGRLDAVKTFADTVLEVGRDQWSGQDTPLFVDGVSVDKHDPVSGEDVDGDTFIPSNLAGQQHLVRTLQGVSALTGEDRYVDAAKAATAYHFDELAGDNGLLHWGGEQCIDLQTLEVAEYGKPYHELKSHFPDYEFMWEVDPEATARYIRAMWNAHIVCWRVLDMNRHGSYNQDLPMENPWDHVWADPDAFFDGEGLTFINFGSELILAAAQLYRLNDEADAWTWGERMAGMYEKARHPDTGLGSQQYSKRVPDRGEEGYAEYFGDVAREGWCLWGNKVPMVYAHATTALLWIGDRLGDVGDSVVRETSDSLLEFFEYAYDADEHAFRPMWADGTDLTDWTVPTSLEEGDTTPWAFHNRMREMQRADPRYLRALLLAYERTGDDRLWEPIQSMAINEDVGQLADDPTGNHDVALEDVSSNPNELYALLALYRVTEDPVVLDRARAVGDAILDERFQNGLFVQNSDPDHEFYDPDTDRAWFDAVEPLALLDLDATIRGRPEDVPTYLTANEGFSSRTRLFA